MASLPLARRLLKLFHPEAIPRPGAAIYDLISGTKVFQHHYDLVARDIVRICAEGRLLDVGTGPGWLLHKLYREAPELRLLGLDASPAMVARARGNAAAAGLAKFVEFREGNVSSMPFADESFTVVVSTGSLHHWKEPTAGLNEVYRVLRHGGHALIYDLVSDTPPSVVREIKKEFGSLRTTLFWLHSFEEPFYSSANLEALARPTRFGEGHSRFVGLLCCLVLRKV